MKSSDVDNCHSEENESTSDEEIEIGSFEKEEDE